MKASERKWWNVREREGETDTERVEREKEGGKRERG